MTFKEILARIVDGTPGGLAAAIVDSDGVAIEEYLRGDAELELASIAVEYGRVLGEAKKVGLSVFGARDGQLSEVLLTMGSKQLFFRALEDEAFLVVALAPGAILGKARWLAGSMLRELREAL